MRAEVISRVLKNVGANAYRQLVLLIIQLLGVPILLHAWGPQLYGEWLILFSIPAYLAIMDLGFSQSAANDMTASVARGDREGALAVFQSLLAMVCGISIGGLILAAVLVFSLPLEQAFRFQAMDVNAVQWVLFLFAVEVLAGLPDGVSHAGFRAAGDYALHLGLHCTGRLIQFAGVWIAALAGYGPVVAAWIYCSVRLVVMLSLASLLVKRHIWFCFGIEHMSGSHMRRLLRPALANVAFPFAQALNIQGMVLVVGAVLGPLAVVTFSTLRTLTRMAMQLILAVPNAMEPEMAAAYGAGDTRLIRSLFVHGLRGALWLGLAAVAGLAIFGSFILDIWTNGKVEMDALLFAWLLVAAIASVSWYGALIVLKAANAHLYASLVYVLGSAIAVGLAAVLLTWSKNVSSAGLAILVIDVLMVLYTWTATASLIGACLLTSLAGAANPLPLLKLARRKVLAR